MRQLRRVRVRVRVRVREVRVRVRARVLARVKVGVRFGVGVRVRVGIPLTHDIDEVNVVMPPVLAYAAATALLAQPPAPPVLTQATNFLCPSCMWHLHGCLC